jgi:predicted dehydrogenase
MVLNTTPDQPLVLIAGTGSIGQRHIRNLRQLRPRARFAFLRRGARRDAMANDLGAEVVESTEAALALRPTLAVVATPSDQHAALLHSLLQAGVPTYIEKPVVTTLADCASLRSLATGTLPPTQVGCVLRFLPSLRQLRLWLSDRRLGRVVRATFEVGQWLPDWRPMQDYRQSYSAHAAQGGGVVFDLVHEIDLACWFFGPCALQAAWGGHHSSLEICSEDVAHLALQGSSHELIGLQLDYVSRVPVRRIHVVGDEASATWDLPRKTLELHAPAGSTYITEGFDTAAAYVEAMRELLDAAAHGTPTSLPLIEGLPATDIAIRANAHIRGEALTA